MRFRTLLFDSDLRSRDRLRQMLAAYTDIEVIGEAGGATEALVLVTRTSPDLLISEIRLNNCDTLRLLSRVDFSTNLVIVSTVSDYALRAIELDAVDYLIKPISPERLRASVRRLIKRGGHSRICSSTTRQSGPDGRVLLNTGAVRELVLLDDIAAVISQGNYTEVHLYGRRPLCVRQPIVEWEEQLPARVFLRIHRRCIVNVCHVERLTRMANGTCAVNLSGRQEPYMVSRRMSSTVMERLSRYRPY